MKVQKRRLYGTRADDGDGARTRSASQSSGEANGEGEEDPAEHRADTVPAPMEQHTPSSGSRALFTAPPPAGEIASRPIEEVPLVDAHLQEIEPAGAPGELGPAAAADGEEQQAAKPKLKRYITLLPSVFEGRPPVLFFSYTVACGAKQRPLERAVPANENAPRMFYSHTDKIHEYNAVINMMRQGGLYRVRPESLRWSLLWSNHPPPEVLQNLRPQQKCNHWPASFHLGRKDLLWRNLSRFQRRFGQPYQITPQGWNLPSNMEAWRTACALRPNNLWIWKPCSQSCGRGIKVIPSTLTDEEAQELGKRRGIVQKYVHSPLLIDGFKFDLRIYVVVISYEPLKVYINDEGLVRIATEKYSASPDTLESRTMHLTNYSVNKASPAFVQNQDGRGGEADEDEGEDGEEAKKDGAPGESQAFKWSLTELRNYFAQRNLSYDTMFDRIKDLVIKTLIAVEPPLSTEWAKALEQPDEAWFAQGPKGAHRASCFETYGFDVIVDSNMKPWLLEVNICPSLSSGSPLDKRIKTKLVADSLTLVGIRPPWQAWRGTAADTTVNYSSSSSGEGSESEGARDDSEGESHRRERKAKKAAAEVLVGDDGSPVDIGSRETCDERLAVLRAAPTPLEAVKMFEETEWDLVLESTDEDMRCGGLERIHPAENSAEYAQFFLNGESYANFVLRKWHEAGGAELLHRSDIVPPWLPLQICFTKT